VRFARDLYTGDLLLPGKIGQYLMQKAVGEPNEAFAERCRLADYTNYYANVIDGFTGMLANVEDDANRKYLRDEADLTSGLGKKDDPNTPIGRLWLHADRDGRGLLDVFDLAGAELSTAHTCWPVVSTTGPAADARLDVLPYEAVRRWRTGADGALAEVLVEEDAAGAENFGAEGPAERQFLYYGIGQPWDTDARVRPALGGGYWLRYRLNTESKEARIVDQGVYRFLDRGEVPQLPIWRASLNLRRFVGYTQARNANALFNKQSELDALLRACGFPSSCCPAARPTSRRS
jgi:hypothetical protein